MQKAQRRWKKKQNITSSIKAQRPELKKWPRGGKEENRRGGISMVYKNESWNKQGLLDKSKSGKETKRVLAAGSELSGQKWQV